MRIDVALIHPPSVYDFRRNPSYTCMISEVIPSNYVFDMIPYGFLTLATYLEKHGYDVAIFNLAAKMIRDDRFDVRSYLKSVQADIYGIDLHWMVHAHGSIEVARIVKELHPESKVILGGLSSTYFGREIMRSYPFIDAIVTGDSGEVPLLKYLEDGPERSPNMIWREDGRIRENTISWVPDSLDEFQIDHGILVRNLKRTRDLAISSPFASFKEAPIAGVITLKGCPFNCATCGGSKFSYENYLMRRKIALKSPEAVAEEVEGISNISTMPIFFIGDLRIGGFRRLERTCELIKKLNLENELIFEFFTPPPRDVLKIIRETSHSVYLQISPESPVEEVRRAFGRPYSNSSLERMVEISKALGFSRLDLYFMLGLPLQTREHSAYPASYFRKLRSISDTVDSFISPLAPFIDPGSRAFVDPEKFGYKLLFSEFEDFRSALLSKHWINSLNYETRWMSRRDLVEASIDGYEALLKAKYGFGMLNDNAYELALERIRLDRLVLERVEKGLPLDDLRDRIRELARERDALIKKSLSLYPTEALASRIRNPVFKVFLRAVTSF